MPQSSADILFKEHSIQANEANKMLEQDEKGIDSDDQSVMSTHRADSQ
jgi:hypothetical protein